MHCNISRSFKAITPIFENISNSECELIKGFTFGETSIGFVDPFVHRGQRAHQHTSTTSQYQIKANFDALHGIAKVDCIWVFNSPISNSLGQFPTRLFVACDMTVAMGVATSGKKKISYEFPSGWQRRKINYPSRHQFLAGEKGSERTLKQDTPFKDLFFCNESSMDSPQACRGSHK